MSLFSILKFAAFFKSCLFLVAYSTKFIQDYDTSGSFPFIRWDAIYFVEIAKHGYTLEQQFAFLPGLPLLMRLLSTTGLSVECSGVLISNTSYFMSVIVLYKLTIKLFHQYDFAYLTCLMFIISPIGIFMASAYTESLFALLSFSGMLCFYSENYLLSTLLWSLSSGVRSNGILFAGFFIHRFIKQRRNLMSNCIAVLTIIAPFIAFQYYGYTQFCSNEEKREWCHGRIPMIYQFVQSHYWNNGFLKYFTLQQSPNFILALPMIWISVSGFKKYITVDPIRFFTLGFVCRKSKKGEQIGFLQDRLLPHVYLWMVMFLTCLLFMHVQVMQRFLSCLPILYWYAAHKLQQQKSTFIIYYCIIYNFIATVLFAKFYPPA